MNRQTAESRIEASLAAIEEHGARTNAFIRVDAEGARAAARAVDAERAKGVDRGPLHGMPMSIKDLVDIEGQPTTAASNIWRDAVAKTDAPIVKRLREAGVVVIGKTNLHEIALGTTSEESAFGAVHNPHDVARSAGGSSGGSAAAVATGMGEASIGTDTGGSIRIPAAACGVVGLKPSLGEVPADGVFALSKTFDHAGPIARSVQDAAWIWQALSGRAFSALPEREVKGVRLGALSGYFTQFLDGDVRAAVARAFALLTASGALVEERVVAGAETIVETYVNISLYEAAQRHAEYLGTRAGEYQPNVRARLEMGRAITREQYDQAHKQRGRLMSAVGAALEGCDVLVLPTLPIVAPLLGQTDAVFENGTLPVRAAMLRLTQLFNVTGQPAVSIPLGTGDRGQGTGGAGLPVGLQLVGRRGATWDLLVVARACERVLRGA